MRSTIGRLAKQASEKYLTPGNPTGLTGLKTAVAPRPVLINVYNRTLDELKKLPASSAYRASAEALTRHRLAVLEAVKPAGHDAWLQRVSSKHPKVVAAADKAGHLFAVDPVFQVEYDPRYTSWDGEGDDVGVNDEGPLVEGQRLNLPQPDPEPPGPDDLIELEPPLTAEQISEIEQKLGAGLIEEVIEVAKGELQLVDVLSEHKVWEELQDKAPEGQWNYFERSSRHTAGDPR